MAVKIRLTRVGKKRQPAYRVVVADSRSPRDGRYIEQIGRYDPTVDPSIVEIDNDRAKYWLSNGAQPSSQVKKLLEISGSLPARPVKERKIRVVAPAPAPVAEPLAVAEPAADAEPAVEAAAVTEGAAPEAAPAAAEEVEAEIDDKVLDMAAEGGPVAEVAMEPVAEAEGEPVAEAAAEPADEEQPS